MGVWPDASPYLVTGWHWWWLLLLLLLLLLLILLCCSLLWCLQRRYRARKDIHRQTTNGQTQPLLRDESEVDRNIRNLDARLDRMRGQVSSAQGDFEKGYVTGYKDANRLGSASAARRQMHDKYGDEDAGFHEGYTKGLRDGGMTGMTTSMHNLAQKSSGLYSAGFMQGYRDGSSGIFGDRVTPSLISRLDEQYPGKDDFKLGFVDGFKEGCKSRVTNKSSFEDSKRLQRSLTELTERLTSLEKTKGDEIHSTKIYHVYNQQPEFAGYSSTGAQLAHELDEMNSRSRTSTLRRHYTPGDYLKYASEEEQRYGSLGRNRRSLSASALARDEDAGRWTDDLIGIVNEPMERTLDRMRQFSTSAANVEGGQSSSQAQQGQEVVEEKYHRSYKEEHSSGGAGR